VTEFDPPRRRTQPLSADTDGVYHTTDCQAFQQLTNWKECCPVEEERMRECRYCAGTDARHGEGDLSYLHAAVNHDPEEAGD